MKSEYSIDLNKSRKLGAKDKQKRKEKPKKANYASLQKEAEKMENKYGFESPQFNRAYEKLEAYVAKHGGE